MYHLEDQPNAIYEFQYAYGLPDYGIIGMQLPLTIVIIGETLDTITYVINWICYNLRKSENVLFQFNGNSTLIS
ncbi:Putative GTPases (G3E family) [Staphylococcus aureus]|uniref:GTPases (G3E family) n=1 Tax=Staphylococcus aureus TaxID=1280 RepID=A0A380E3A0_STAAU|nr:Putative GTPases (G3E family) [Staphylococcus aureus]